MKNTIFIAIISWLLPGFGHIQLGRWRRGIIIGAVIWTMFLIAVISGGMYYPGFTFKEGALLYLLNAFARMGNGLGGLISLVLAVNPPKDVAAWTVFEYGGRFLEVSGLLNLLAVIDAVDINVGRKK